MSTLGRRARCAVLRTAARGALAPRLQRVGASPVDGVDAHALVGRGAVIAPWSAIGPGAVVGPGSVVGPMSALAPGAVVCPGAVVGPTRENGSCRCRP